MDKKELSTSLHEALGLEGFCEVKLGPGALVLEKQTNFSLDRISISYNSYHDEYVFAPYVVAWKYLIPIENILSKVSHKTSLYTIYKNSSRHEKLVDYTIQSQNDIDFVAPKFNRLISEELLPFFCKYDNIQEVYIQIKNLDKSEMTKFVCNPPIPRLMIIKRLANDPEWKDFSEWALDIYEKMASGPRKAQHAHIYALLPDLYKELQNLDPSQIIQPPAV